MAFFNGLERNDTTLFAGAVPPLPDSKYCPAFFEVQRPLHLISRIEWVSLQWDEEVLLTCVYSTPYMPHGSPRNARTDHRLWMYPALEDPAPVAFPLRRQPR